MDVLFALSRQRVESQGIHRSSTLSTSFLPIINCLRPQWCQDGLHDLSFSFSFFFQVSIKVVLKPELKMWCCNENYLSKILTKSALGFPVIPKASILSFPVHLAYKPLLYSITGLSRTVCGENLNALFDIFLGQAYTYSHHAALKGLFNLNLKHPQYIIRKIIKASGTPLDFLVYRKAWQIKGSITSNSLWLIWCLP